MYEITGQVKDKITNKNLAYCNITLLKEKEVVSGGISDDDGYFYFNVYSGRYKIIFSYIGYRNDTITTNLTNSNKFLGVFKLSPIVNQLSDVIIKTSKITNKIDKDVVYITDNERKKAVETGGILEKINGVTYDRFNNSIKVDNNPNVKLLINNLDKDVNYIMNLDPKKIKKVEIIRYPSGKYGLENYATVLNIITFRDYIGYSINSNDMGVFDPKTKGNYFPINQLNTQLDYTHNRINYYLQLSNQINNINTNYYSKYKTNNLSILNEPANNLEKNRKSKYFMNKIVLGADFYINPKNTFSYEFGVSYPDRRSSVFDSRISYYDASNSLINQERFNQNTSSTNKNIRNSIFYHGIIDQHNSIDVSYSFNLNTNTFKQKTIFETTNIDLSNKGDAKSSQLSIEYNHDITNKLSYNLGCNNAFYYNTYTYVNAGDKSDYNFSNLKNNIYSNFSWSINKKSGVKIGLAYELYSLKTKEAEWKNYQSFQPFLNYRYLFNKNTSVRLSYTVNSTYPGNEQTTPYSTYVNNNIIRVGNPILAPSYLHQINTQWSFLNNKLVLIPYYYFSKNHISIFTRPIDNDKLEYSYKNFDYYSKKGVELNYAFYKRYLYIISSLDFSRSYIEYQNNKNNLNNLTISVQLNYTENKTKMMFFLDYNKSIYKTINLNGYNMENMDYTILGVRKMFFKNRLMLMFMYIPPVGFGMNYERTNFFKTSTIEATEKLDLGAVKNFLFIKMNYRFGNGHSVRKNKKKIFEENKERKGIL